MRRLGTTLGISWLALLLLAWPAVLQAQEQERAGELPTTAPVVVDGEELFRVRGVSSYPAHERAAAIARAIREAANDPSFDPRSVRIEPVDFGARIMAGPRRLMVVVDADSQGEGVRPSVLASLYAQRISRAIGDYRKARLPGALRGAWLGAALGLVALALGVALVFWLGRRLDRLLENRLRRHVQALEDRSFRIVDSQRIWSGVRGTVRLLRALAVLAMLYVFLSVVLARFPWTRGIAGKLAGYALTPLHTMGTAFVSYIPNLIFLAILYFVLRTVIRLARVFFESIEHGTITLANFEPEWAVPTYRIVRLLIVAFGVVIAYPFVPGSESAAFKGVSLFLGVMFSLGSSSAVSNIIAGYLLTYRRAFKLGDRIRIGDKVGAVSATRVQVTHLTTPKNEELIIPNATILNSEVINYSTIARTEGLILHTTVGIGYDTPWRQVEAMLLIAAANTEGVLAEPAPFVNQLALGDFAVTYELNVYVREPHRMLALYSALHRNILDVFNEHGVAIMTPAYEGDPEQPKVVPKDQWFTAPAAADGRAKAGV
jgi:small-conductance mechanosensitive channel